MARRQAKNKTGIKRIKGVKVHNAWIAYICVKCNALNYLDIGKELLDPNKAFENCAWKCKKCGYVHSKESDLTFLDFDDKKKSSNSILRERFWKGFFRIATENPEAYWKKCNSCGRVLPFNAFSKHKNWGPLERQMECRCCKGAINADLNAKRSKQQLHESSVRRRIGDLFLEGENEDIDTNDLFKRFENKCFKTGRKLNSQERGTWAVDHILPSKFLYPLTKKNAALLSKEANEDKRDKWPSEFYTNNQLIELAKISGANLDLISSKDPIINTNIDVNKCVDRVLKVREKSDLQQRIKELKKLIQRYKLEKKLTSENKKLLGLSKN